MVVTGEVSGIDHLCPSLKFIRFTVDTDKFRGRKIAFVGK